LLEIKKGMSKMKEWWNRKKAKMRKNQKSNEFYTFGRLLGHIFDIG